MFLSLLLRASYSDADKCTPDDSVTSFQFFDLAPLDDVNVRIYRHTSNKDKFYFAPLVLLDHTSSTSFRNNVTYQNEMSFYVEMWTDELHQQIADYVSDVTALSTRKNQIAILPFDQVIVQFPDSQFADYKLTSTSHSFLQTPKRLELRLVCGSLERCHQLAVEMNENPYQFAHLGFQFVFDNVKLQHQTIAITSQHIRDSRILTQLYQNYPIIGFLTSENKKLVLTEIMANVLGDVESESNSIIDPRDEMRVGKYLENLLFCGETGSTKIRYDDLGKWKTVYWRDDDTRPDLLANNLNKAYRTVKNEQREMLVTFFNS